MFNIEMFPAGHGDCLWIEYGDAQSLHRILIDGGTAPTYKHLKSRIESLAPDQRHFDLFIITHVDGDHIEGAVRLLGDQGLGVTFADIWFNGWRHLPTVEDDKLGPVQGEMLSALIEDHKLPWNLAFGGQAVVVPDDALPEHTLPGKLRLTLLSPTPEQLIRLRPKWNQEVRKAGLEPGVAREALEKLSRNRRLQPDALGEEKLNVKALAEKTFVSDRAEANGSSIAVLAEYEGKRCLLTGDAFAPVLLGSIQRLLNQQGLERLTLDACKLPHHGSQNNVSRELFGLLRCQNYLFSTNGNIFNHPDAESVARVILYGKPRGKNPVLYFNYRSEENEIWDDQKLMEQYEYSVILPKEGSTGLLINL